MNSSLGLLCNGDDGYDDDFENDSSNNKRNSRSCSSNRRRVE